jgi:hypothetical protein
MLMELGKGGANPRGLPGRFDWRALAPSPQPFGQVITCSSSAGQEPTMSILWRSGATVRSGDEDAARC